MPNRGHPEEVWDGVNRRKKLNSASTDTRELFTRLTTIENSILVLTLAVNNDRENNTKILKKFEVFLEGNGKDGANVRLVRLEDKEGDRQRTWYIALTALIGVFVKSIWDFFHN